MWGDEEVVESGLPAGTDAELSVDEYLALVSNGKISFITRCDDEEQEHFYGRLGQELKHSESTNLHATAQH